MPPNSYTRAVNLLELCFLFLAKLVNCIPERLFRGLFDPSVIYSDSFSKLWKEELCNRNRSRQRKAEKEESRDVCLQRRERERKVEEEERTNGKRKRRERVRRRRKRAATTSGRVYLRHMTRVCQHCQALIFPSEPLNCCCNVTCHCLVTTLHH